MENMKIRVIINGEVIREARKKRGWTLKDLGNQTKLSADHIGVIERGVRQPKNSTLVRICSVLHLRLEEVIHIEWEENQSL